MGCTVVFENQRMIHRDIRGPLFEVSCRITSRGHYVRPAVGRHPLRRRRGCRRIAPVLSPKSRQIATDRPEPALGCASSPPGRLARRGPLPPAAGSRLLSLLGRTQRCQTKISVSVRRLRLKNHMRTLTTAITATATTIEICVVLASVRFMSCLPFSIESILLSRRKHAAFLPAS